MFLWKAIKLIGYLFFLITLFIVIGSIYTQFTNSKILMENASIPYNIGSFIGYCIGLLLLFFPSIWLVKFANQKIKNKKDNFNY